ncbi:hypothetical protein ABB37_01652 [Leptomonas pyrrhocoris]|uniref:Uncharacterized protein n=1 Tax=Leptomonas pyrrhocoris TaxID=157538 RepID=A0A0M9G9G0_LEPPY|nr:hypothetical protein ABB37_01652 [Leptomonas pyrrhocoris]KPA85319.1 hypothetical protein ABB37_01652 [Leptomonas pyrrhocoris]|eukprot:XP_015663758.1 hypothetical protein ABB37_01652 [Leptomonas pyrrhocoris]
MMVPPSRASSNSLFQDVPRGNKLDMTSPGNGLFGTSAAAAPRAGRYSNVSCAFVSYRGSACSLADYVEDDDPSAAVLRGDSDFSGMTPSASSNAFGRSGRNGEAQTTIPKRKPPHLFKRLANELRWMHNNFKYGYHSGYTPKHHQQDSPGFLTTPQTTRDDFGVPEDEEELLTMSVRSSLRRSSRSQSAVTSARESGKRTTAAASAESGARHGLQKTRWHTMENGEVEAIRMPRVPRTTPDPYAPPDCCYVVRHCKRETDAAGEASRSASCSSAARRKLGPSVDSAEEVTLPDAYFSGSMMSYTDSDGDDHDSLNSSSSERVREDDSSDLEEGATMGACLSDRQRASDDTLNDLAAKSGRRRSDAAFNDGYDEFLCGVAQLQRQVHKLEQHTSQLRELYAREQKARLHCKSKGQHLSWTRTMEAANTIQFWRVKVTLLRHFESQYVNAVRRLQQELPLVDPASETAFLSTLYKKVEDVSSPLMQSRRRFVQSSRVIAAQRKHLRALGEQLQSCWQTNANLREELRQFEQWEMRNPHDTFAVAGMDAEHFIASLPPRISAYALCSDFARTSPPSPHDTDDASTPRLLLTAQNLSPSSDDDNAHVAPQATEATDAISKSTLLGRATGDAAPLASCIKTTAADVASSEAARPVSPLSSKRLKYVIQSATFDTDDTAATADAHANSTSGRQSHRCSSASRTTTPMAGAVSSFESQQRRRRERHVTFALEPEVLDARPRFSAHGRTIELLEHICRDKQVQWSGLTLLQAALDERNGELAAMQASCKEQPEEEEEQPELLARAVTATPICANMQNFHCASEPHETDPDSVFKPPSDSASLEKTKSTGKCCKVKPNECAQCVVM